MSAFNGDSELRKRCLENAAIIQERLKKGEDRKNLFWSRHRWCEPSTTCKIGDCRHDFYASEIGVPAVLAYAEHALFLELPAAQAATWPKRWLKAIPFSAEEEALNASWKSFALELLNDPRTGMIAYAQNRAQNDAIVRIIELFEQNCPDKELWASAAAKAHQARHTDSYIGSGSAGCKLQAGINAAFTAALLAETFAQPQSAALAVVNSPYSWRFATEADYRNKGAYVSSDQVDYWVKSEYLRISKRLLAHVSGSSESGWFAGLLQGFF